jgi:hypothetical protein
MQLHYPLLTKNWLKTKNTRKDDAPRRTEDNVSSAKPGNRSIVGVESSPITSNSIRRFAILLMGWTLGFVWYVPSVMMSASGSPKALLAANIGLMACRLLALGGCIGFVFHDKTSIGWKALIPGVICLLSFFIVDIQV